MKPLEQLRTEIVDSFKKLQPRESPLPLARLIVEARRDHFITPRGGPDLQGRSFAWRNWYGDILREAFPDENERLKMGSRLRYGIGVALREMIPTDELKEAGLMETSPRERTANNNKERASAYNLLNHKIETSRDVRELFSMITRAAANIKDPELLQELLQTFEDLPRGVERWSNRKAKLEEINAEIRANRAKSE